MKVIYIYNKRLICYMKITVRWIVLTLNENINVEIF